MPRKDLNLEDKNDFMSDTSNEYDQTLYQKYYGRLKKKIMCALIAALLSVSTGKTEKSNTLNAAINNMSKKTRDLRRQLRKAIIDHISDSFLDTTVPLLVLIEAAKNGREKEIKEYAAIFHEHTGRLVEVSVLLL
ncbi:catenin alpha-3 isoform X1 [Sigmodon hispidus]